MSRNNLIPAIIFCILFTAVDLKAARPELKISGLKIYSEKQLLGILRLSRYLGTRQQAGKTVRAISNFYMKNGYTLARIYILENSRKRLNIFVDEGRLGRIVFPGLDELDLIRVKTSFLLEKKIFNINTMRENIYLLKKKYGYPSVTYSLVRVKSYSESRFQLDRELDLPILGKTQLPFFDEIGHRYDLVVYVTKGSKSRATRSGRRKKSGVGYKLKINMSRGFIPMAGYYHHDLIRRNDFFESEASVGIMYGLDRNFSDLPRPTFLEVKPVYHFAPFMTRYFTPLARGSYYWSHAARPDLGLTIYDYHKLVGAIAPGFTLLKKYRIYTGFGFEAVYFRNSENDPESDYQVYIERKTEYYNFFELVVKLEFIPIRIGNPRDRNIIFNYSHYFQEGRFNELNLQGIYDFDFRNNSIYSFDCSYRYNWYQVPFHHEFPVSDNFFRGLRGYYSRHRLALANEYLLSVYRDYIYTGLFLDMTVFEGSGYDISGTHTGIVAGPGMRFLVLGQFEMFVYYGQDLLFPGLSSRGNLSFSIHRKW